MCGIAGFIDLSKSFSRENLTLVGSRMAMEIQHRGPNHQGIWSDEKQGIMLAHQRLSIIDFSPNGYQPMYSLNERYVMVYNGEIYNFKILRRELIQKGEQFCGHSDTEVLIAAFSCWGIDETLKTRP